jgi:hypothetical protein
MKIVEKLFYYRIQKISGVWMESWVIISDVPDWPVDVDPRGTRQ